MSVIAAPAKYLTMFFALFFALCASSTVNGNLGIAVEDDLKYDNTTYALPVTVVHEFPRGTWIENIAVRKNGQILVTETTRPRVYQVDPFGVKQPIVVHEFTDTASVTGITEAENDVFYVSTANLSSDFLKSYGQSYIYKIDMRTFNPDQPRSAEVSKVAYLPQAEALNGLAYLGEGTNTLLNADTLRGLIWSIDIRSGKASVAINNTLTQPMGLSVNGLKVRGTDVYFTNSIQELLAKVPVNSTGYPTGPAAVIANGGFSPDDLALSSGGDAYVTSFSLGSNAVLFTPHEGSPAVPIAGTAGPTSCAFGRTLHDCGILYISTSGGAQAYINGHGDSVAGKVVKAEVDRHGLFGCKKL